VFTVENAEPVFVDPAEGNYKRGIFNAIIAPRPIGWISTVNVHGVPNLAPFSYFNIMSNLPPILVFSCNTPEDRPLKDTVVNVRETGEFVFNLVSLELVEAMNKTSTPTPYGVDEFDFADLEKAPSVNVCPPRVALSPAALECKVIKMITLGGGDEGPETNITFGQVVGMHILPGFLHDDGRFDTARAQPVARLGGVEYAVSQPSFNLPSQFTRAKESSY
jgi:flavin reductase (DIM6/NTAB) family NADH-FMN oxidoreductase RutF